MSLRRSYLCNLIRAAFVFLFAHSASFIVVPPIEIEPYVQYQRVGHRRLIVEDMRDGQSQRKQFSEAIPCIESFLKRHIQEPSRSILLMLDDGKDIAEIAHPLITFVKSRFAVYTHSTEKEFDTRHGTAMSAVVLMSNGSSVQESFYLLDPCDRSCTYIAVLVTNFDDEESFLSDVDVLARSMWSRRISILIVLARVRGTVFAAGSRHFEPDKFCSPSPSVVQGRCDGDTWKNSKQTGVPELNGCILTVAYIEQPPYVVKRNDTEILEGFEGTLIEELTKGMRVAKVLAEWIDNASYVEQTQMLLYGENTKADLVIGRILQHSQKSIGYSTTYDMLKLVMVVPKVPNVSLQGLIHPFHCYIWAAIGGTLVLGCFIKVFLIRDVSWLEIFGLIIGVSVARRPTRLSGKIHFISWSIFGLFLAQFYVDSLADQLINESDLKFKTMKELISSSFEIGGTSAIENIFEKFEHTETIVRIRDKFVTFDQGDYIDQFMDLLSGRNTSLALVAVLNSSRSDAIETAYAYTLTTDVICSFPIAIATWKGFPYLKEVNSRIHDFIDQGIFDFMINQAIAKETRSNMFTMAVEKERQTELHLQQFVPAFLLTIIGFSGGLLCLMLEIILYPRRILEGRP